MKGCLNRFKLRLTTRLTRMLRQTTKDALRCVVAKSIFSGALLLAALVFLPAAGLAIDESSQTDLGADPAAAGNDILNGQRILLESDDLLYFATQTNPPTAGDAVYTYTTLFTADGAPEDPVLDRVGPSTLCDNPLPSTSQSATSTPLQSWIFRPFLLKRGLVVTVHPTDDANSADCSPVGSSDNMAIELTDPVGDPVGGTIHVITTTTIANPNLLVVAVADFNFDGFEDLFILSESEVLLVTAVDPTDPSQGLTVANRFDASGLGKPFGQPSVGDLNVMSGQSPDAVNLEVAWPAQGNRTNIVTVCRGGSTSDAICQGMPAFAVVVAGASPPIHTDQVNFNNFAAVTAIGNYVPELGTGDLITTFGNNCELRLFQLSPDLSTATQVGDTVQPPPCVNQFFGPFVSSANGQSAELQFDSGRDQLVLGAFGNDIYVQVVTFDSMGNMTLSNAPHFQNQDGTAADAGVTVGLFRAIPDDPTPEELNLQIAFLRYVIPTNDTDNCAITTDGDIGIYDVSFDENGTATLTLSGTYAQPAQVAANGCYPAGTIFAGDLQGRSVLLGQPEVMVVETHTEPTVILASPPSHIDFIQAQGQNAATVNNFSAYPAGYNSVFEFNNSGTNQSSRASTTSYSYATKTTDSDTGAQSYSLGPVSGDLSQSVQFANSYSYENTTKQTYNTFTKLSYNSATSTFYNDKVWFKYNDISIYSYPVLGQTGCPQTTVQNGVELTCTRDGSDCSCCDTNDTCQLIDPGQTYVQYSLPSDMTYTIGDGGTLEWYQPVYEPGNLFSYPATLGQYGDLELGLPILDCSDADASGACLLSDSSPNQIDPTNGTDTTTFTWSSGSEEGSSVGSNTTHTQDKTTSASGSVSLIGGASEQTSYQTSSSAGTLNTDSTTLGQSTGVTVNIPGQAVGSAYYKVSTFIFGQASGAPQQPCSSENPDDPAGCTGEAQDINTGGPIRVLHTANIIDQDAAGTFWGTAYSVQDVALNHPNRWTICGYGTAACSTTYNQDSPECLGPINQFDCAILNPASEATQSNGGYWDAGFYQMRGFFVTSASAPGIGPQLTSAVDGDILWLQARVYNYSFAPTPAGSRLCAAFYAQPVQTDGSNPSNPAYEPSGPSIQINPGLECSDLTIPGLNDDTSTIRPNSLLLGYEFDTTGFGGQNVVFWLVVWVDDGAGNIVADLSAHGVDATKGSALEGLSYITDVPISKKNAYSNNVGYFHRAFYIASSSDELTAAVGGGDLSIDSLALLGEPLLSNKLRVRATVRSSGAPSLNVPVTILNRDPDGNVTVVDQEQLSFVPANDTHQVAVLFRPRQCGSHQVIVEAGKAREAIPAVATVVVTLDAQAQTQSLMEQVEALGLKGGRKKSLLAKLNAAARSFQKGNQKVGLNQLDAFANALQAQNGKGVPSSDAIRMIAQVANLQSCLHPER